MSSYFGLNFHHTDNVAEGGDNGIVYLCTIVPPDPTGQFTEDYEWLDFLGNMESYGVHDFTTFGPNGLVGYYSYEIKGADQPTVVQQWHDYMTARGLEPGPMERMTYAEYEARFA